MTLALYLLSILGLGVLMIVHEAGHFVAARRFGMRVQRFSIGFGPTIWKHKPKNSPTTYQVALIPFLAYVQIAGMNPYEEIDPQDRTSYANASLWARIVTIGAGPLTNYLFASVLIFFGALLAGKPSMRVVVEPGPAQVAGIQTGDRILSVNGVAVKSWDEIRKEVTSHAGQAIDVTVDRKGATLHETVTPIPKGQKDEGMIHVAMLPDPVGVLEAAEISLVDPPLFVYENARAIARVVAGKEKLQISGPVGIVKEAERQARVGPGFLLTFLGMLSAYLGAFNLVPFPALDGGRLIFLGIEAVSRRKPHAKLEAQIHAVGVLMLLTLIAVVTYSDIVAK